MSTKPGDNGLKCAIDHMLEAQQKGEINEDNVLYIVENINVAGMFLLANPCYKSPCDLVHFYIQPSKRVQFILGKGYCCHMIFAHIARLPRHVS